ncbi:hypothetical protein IQ06DRAFT_97284 [Phaeosphaeriaceae sp. SRC1lsM3a]|nr:hypothetical protein IQ06DRAFT_97284 [Stagonospora sp. SRC1lsM3a]
MTYTTKTLVATPESRRTTTCSRDQHINCKVLDFKHVFPAHSYAMATLCVAGAPQVGSCTCNVLMYFETRGRSRARLHTSRIEAPTHLHIPTAATSTNPTTPQLGK